MTVHSGRLGPAALAAPTAALCASAVCQGVFIYLFIYLPQQASCPTPPRTGAWAHGAARRAGFCRRRGGAARQGGRLPRSQPRQAPPPALPWSCRCGCHCCSSGRAAGGHGPQATTQGEGALPPAAHPAGRSAGRCAGSGPAGAHGAADARVPGGGCCGAGEWYGVQYKRLLGVLWV